MGALLNLNVQLEQMACINCGVEFAFPSRLAERLRVTHHNFYCPSGHAQHFTAETDAERFKRELEEERARHGRTLTRLNSAEKTARKAQRSLKRVHLGVCPCCNRTFQNLARHMATQHPELAPPPSGSLPK